MTGRTALIFDADLNRRARLSDVLRLSLNYTVHGAAVIEDSRPLAIWLDKAKEPIVFAGTGFGSDRIAGLVQDTRTQHADAVFVGLLPEDRSEQENLAELLIVGLHSFLCEPYSPPAVHEAIKLGRLVHKQGSRSRLKAGAGMLLERLILARNGERQETEGGDLLRKVKSNCRYFKEVTGQSITNPVIRTLQNLAPRERARQYQDLAVKLRSLLDRGKP